MKTAALKAFRQKLSRDEPVYGLWVTLESASITEMAVALGLDWVVIDIEHGHLDWKDVLEHVRATVRSETVILARIVGLDQGVIKRVLDIGADGVVIPWVETADQIRTALACARYPMEGVRGIGGERATCWGQCLPQHVAEANENVLVIPIIESVQGARNLSQMLQVPGVEMFFFGPSDYSSTAGFAGQWEGPGVAEQILAMKDRIRAAGRHCGVIATGDVNLSERIEQGFRMLAIGLDGGLLIRSLKVSLSAVGREAVFAPSLSPQDVAEARRYVGDGYGGSSSSAAPQSTSSTSPAAPPQAPSSRSTLDWGSGTCFQALLTPSDATKELLTGMLTLPGGARVGYHRHDCPVSLTLLRGQVVADVEGRMHTLQACDSIALPSSTAYALTNRSSTSTAAVHVVLASAHPRGESVDAFYSRRAVPAGAPLRDCPERIVHHRPG